MWQERLRIADFLPWSNGMTLGDTGRMVDDKIGRQTSQAGKRPILVQNVGTVADRVRATTIQRLGDGGNNTRDSDCRLPSQGRRDGDVWVGWLSSHKSSVNGSVQSESKYLHRGQGGGWGVLWKRKGDDSLLSNLSRSVTRYLSTVFRSK